MLHGFDSQSYLASKRGFSLRKRKTKVSNLYESSEHYAAKLKGIVSGIAERQDALYASRTWSILLILQGMDTSGKDGVIKSVLSGINPQGCHVATFKRPSESELDHDYLWRVHAELPKRGHIGVFNRSYYEETLIARVRPEVLKSQRLPPELVGAKRIWKDRFEDIRWFESYLGRQGTCVLKFFLHISKNEQRERLLSRLQEPSKQWKVDLGDVVERASWKRYQDAYEDCISATHCKTAPWYAIPADDKRNARLMISQIVLEKLKTLDLKRPMLNSVRKRELLKTERALLADRK